jgi:carboxylesterase
MNDHIVERSVAPFFYRGGKTGILLIHGFTGTPSELRPLGQYLRDRGYTVYAPLLAGHGTTSAEMEKTEWMHWWQSAQAAYERMQQEGLEWLFVAGLSMGGCLALNLASEQSVTGVIPMCAPIWIKDRRVRWVHFLRYLIRYQPRFTRPSRREPHIAVHLVPADRTPLKCVSSLTRLIDHVKERLPDVQAPALVIQARHDELILPKSAEYIYAHISSKIKRLSWYENSTHIITVDRERNKLFQEIDAFMQKLTNR